MATGFKTATVKASDVPSTQTNFPAYVDLSRLGITTQAEADSVRVYADSGKTTQWAREIVSVSQMWVKIPSLTSTTAIYVDWDGVSANYANTDTYGRNAVWTGFAGVWHLEEASGNTSDSTANGNNLTDNNTVGGGTGKIGNARDFETSNSEYFSITDGAQTGLDITGNMSMVMWINPESARASQTVMSKYVTTGNQRSYIFDLTTDNTASSNIQALYISESGDGSVGVPSKVPTIAMSTGSWSHIAVTLIASSGTAEFYVNGVSQGTSTSTEAQGAFNSTAPFQLGAWSAAWFFDGLIDEAKIAATTLSDDWITTEYNNQSDEADFWGTWSNVGGGGNTTNFFYMT